MKDNLISVIIPIYKVEPYLNRCVESVINQTYKNLEIILVDDGSPDNCPKMCDEWAKRDNRIVVIHKKNGGVSSARNFGIDAAQGKYITFVDSDDYLNTKFVELLYDSMSRYDSQISMCSIIYESTDRVLNNPQKGKKTVCLKIDEKFDISKISYSNAAWGALYELGLIKQNEINFNVNYFYGEDCLFFYQILKCCKKLTYIKEGLYFHYNNPNGVCNQVWSDKRWTGILSCEEKLETVKIFPSTYCYEKVHYFGVIISEYQKAIHGNASTEILKLLYDRGNQNVYELFWMISKSKINFVGKIKLFKRLLFTYLKFKRVKAPKGEIKK